MRTLPHFMPLRRLAVLAALLVMLAAPSADAVSPDCQIVIGSCHSAPLSTPEGTGILDRVVIEDVRRIGYHACIEPLLLVTRQHHVLHRRHENLLEPLAAASRAMKADGSYATKFRDAGVQPPEVI